MNDEDTHFINKLLGIILENYNVKHWITTTYHLQTNGQDKVSNSENKTILKRLWVPTGEIVQIGRWMTCYVHTCQHRRHSFGMSPYMLVCEKVCHLPVELEHRVSWPPKNINLDHVTEWEIKNLQLNELDEFCTSAYENAKKTYKETAKKSGMTRDISRSS